MTGLVRVGGIRYWRRARVDVDPEIHTQIDSDFGTLVTIAMAIAMAGFGDCDGSDAING